jgi:hypothetical protein
VRTSDTSFRPLATLVAALLLALVSSGCVTTTQQARYVYQDGEYGVVGIPENTNRWPHRYQNQAETLMERHFPEGHEIVRAEEVDEGSRTLEIKGTGTAEIAPSLPSEILSVAKLGRTASRSQSDQVKIRECRIVYRRAARPAELSTFGDDPSRFGKDPATFTDQASLTPDTYIDPNAAVRQAATAKGGKTSGSGATAVASKSDDATTRTASVTKPADGAAKVAIELQVKAP